MRKHIWIYLFAAVLMFSSCDFLGSFLPAEEETETEATTGTEAFMNHDAVISTSMDDEVAFILYNDGEPAFDEEDVRDGTPYIELSDLDELGRVGVVQGLFDITSFPDDDREAIGSVYPTGFEGNNNTYSFLNYIYNRCHLLGHQFSGLNADERNLITGTRFFNIEGNLAYENIVTDHMETFNGDDYPKHQILIRVTPDFHEDNLLAHGEIYEADCLQCDDIDFAVYMFNKQPGVTIDYRTGQNWANTGEKPIDPSTLPGATDYVYSVSGTSFHLPSCWRIDTIAEENIVEIKAPRDYMIDALDLEPCGNCKP